MIPRLRNLFFTMAIAVAPVAQGAVPDEGCASAFFAEVKSLSALPAALRAALAAGSPGGKIADVGEPFNATDVLFNDFAQQRLISGRLAPDCAVIVVERGGRGYAKITITVERNGESWSERSRTTVPPSWNR